MLKVDLRQLERTGRTAIDENVPADAGIWSGTGIRPGADFQVRLEAQLAGNDVVVRGRIEGSIGLNCSRCLRGVPIGVEEEIAILFRPGLTEAEAEDAEVYRLPERGDELDLTEAIREHLVLSVPQYAICSEACRGLCPRCGANLNETDCGCEAGEEDPRWAALRKFRSE